MSLVDGIRRRRQARLRRRLAALADRPVNYNAESLDVDHPPAGWNVDRRCEPLGGEPPGEPVPGGTWEIARRLIRGYEFADPSLVRAHYDPDVPLEDRNMLLELRALGLFGIFVGVRVVRVYDETRRIDDRPARVFGWAYRTLEGHVEQGQMDWQVWKWLDSGGVEFRVHAVSRTARIRNPIIAIAFPLLKTHERVLFLNSTDRRMATFTALALRREGAGEQIRAAAPELTARRMPSGDRSHETLAQNVEEPEIVRDPGGPQ
jgi:uncharacterized protein (UPF0548 family)